jgi:hypothetical protein
LDQNDLKLEALGFLTKFKFSKVSEDGEADYLKIEAFQKYLNEKLLVKLPAAELKGVILPIAWSTARAWMHRLGYGYGPNTKNVYVDGHDRADNVEFREGFLERNLQYEKRCHLFIATSNDAAKSMYGFSDDVIAAHTIQLSSDHEIVQFHVDEFDFNRDDTPLGGALSVLCPGRPLLSFVQDEAIFRAYDGAKKFWLKQGETKLGKKGEGRGIMASAFLSEQFGFVSLAEEQFLELNALRARIGKAPLKFFTSYNCKYYPSLYLFDFGKNREGYWDGDKMLEQTDEFIDVLEFLFGDRYQLLFQFDWSSGHAKYAAGALNANEMNSNYGGKQGRLNPAQIQEDYVIPSDLPCYSNFSLPFLKVGDIQHMIFLENDPPPFYAPKLQKALYVNQPKGLKQVLYERGLYREGMTVKGPKDGSNVQLSMKFVLSQCLDFKNQKSALQELIERRGHICEFSPKYHAELAAIERSWGLAKRWLRQVCNYKYKGMVEKLPKALLTNQVQPIHAIRRFFRKT